MINKIKKLLGMKYEIDSKPFRKVLRYYPYRSESSGEYLYAITSVKAFQKDNRTIVEIRTHRPGHLIGWHGVTINGIKDLMKMETNKDIEIFIIEEDMFNHLYD